MTAATAGGCGPQTLDEVRALAGGGNVVPLVRELPADLLTPVAAFLRIGAAEPHAFLLESVEGGESMARYSFLGAGPTRVLRARGLRWQEEAAASSQEGEGPALDRLRDWMRTLRPVSIPGLPRFTGGAVGYLSYDAVRWLEKIPESVQDDLNLPDMEFGFYGNVLAFDHVQHRILLIDNLFTEEGDLSGQYSRAVERLDVLQSKLLAPPPMQTAARPPRETRFSSNVTLEEFEDRVVQAKKEILAGEIFQVVLSQRFECAFDGDPFTAYRALRRVNPSPYMFYLRLGRTSLAGASPEMLVRVEGDGVRTRPIAGTRPRGRDAAEDASRESELRGDPKERAEHLMLVDLGRNDLGRVCRSGSITVDEYQTVERYSHVMHLVSEVSGRLRAEEDALSALAACFPAGTVSGAPKVRAMEIIDRLERTRRGPYAGAVGYLDFSGDLDSCITIRTLLVQDGRAYAQAGAGIVADSSPRREYEETVAKATALLEAVRRAREWFP